MPTIRSPGCWRIGSGLFSAKPSLWKIAPAAGPSIGTAAVAKARADGYTILLVSPAHTINPHILKTIPYDALRDFTPISQLTRTAYVLVTSQASKFHAIEDIVSAAAAPDGQIRFASSGTGSAPPRRTAVVNAVRCAGHPHPLPGRSTRPPRCFAGRRRYLFFQHCGSEALHLNQNRCAPLGVSSHQAARHSGRHADR